MLLNNTGPFLAFYHPIHLPAVQIRGWPAECTCPAPPASSMTVTAGQRAQVEDLVNVHAKSRLILEPLRPLRSEDKARREPARTGRGPSPAQCKAVTGSTKVGNGQCSPCLVSRLFPVKSIPKRSDS